MSDYSWAHCSIKDGSIIGISEADNFNADNLSSAMKKKSFHVKLDAPFSYTKKYHDEVLHDVEVAPGIIVQQVKHMYRYLIDINTFFSAEELVLIKDAEIEVEPTQDIYPVSIILERL